MHFVARWARRLSWKETAAIFGVSWDCVYSSIQWLVEWGLAHRDLSGVTALGIDELHWGKGKKSANFVTVIYQNDADCRRLLWIGQRRTEATLRGGLRALETLHAGFCAGITVVCSDMWKPYLKVVRTLLSAALNILDRFHIAQHLHRALDDERRGEQSRMNAAARARIKGARFVLLKRRSRVRGKACERLHDALIALKETSQAWVYKEAFRRFWRFRCPRWAGAWLRGWVQTVKKSGLKPMVRVATMLENHHDLLLNYFRAKRQYTNAVTEGLNHKARVSLAKAYGCDRQIMFDL
jgi:transposase